jgi:hypothetical protein
MVCYGRGEPDQQSAFIRETGLACDTKNICREPSSNSSAAYMNSWTKEANDNDLKTTFIQGKQKAKGRLWKHIIVAEDPEGITAVNDEMFNELPAPTRKSDAARNRKCES